MYFKLIYICFLIFGITWNRRAAAPFLIFIFFIGGIFFGFAQQAAQTDSLLNNLKLFKNDTNRVNTLNRLIYQLTASDPKEALRYAKESILLSEKLGFKKGLALANVYHGMILNTYGKNKQAYAYFDKAIAIFSETGDKRGIAWTKTSLAELYFENGEYERALQLLFETLKINEKIGNEYGYGWSLVKIANIYSQINKLPEAERYYHKAMKPLVKHADSSGIGTVYNGLGTVYDYMGNYPKAIDFYKKALFIHRRFKNHVDIMSCLTNIGVAYFYNGEGDLALDYLNESNRMAEKMNSLSSLATNHVNLGEVCISKKDYERALQHLALGYEYSKKLGIANYIKESLRLTSEAYRGKGDYKSALEYKNLYSRLNDSLLNAETNQQISEIGIKYESEKKEKENILLHEKNERSALTIQQQRTTTYLTITGLVLVSGLAFFIFRGLKQSRRANAIISEQKQEVEKAKGVIELQKELVEEKQKDILDSIHYAQRIQKALLASHSLLSAHLGGEENYFVYFKPKDIVSGDFYWAAEHKNRFYLAVCDSTGHGVPGAFMSLLNMGFLSEAIKEKGISEPHEVLNYVRTRLIESISGDGQKDGFDGILLCIDKEKNTLTYSAAHNPPVLVNQNELTGLTCDKMPVGKGEKPDSFTLFTIEAKKGDHLYLYTDGYPDQFGGPKGKKFKYRQMEELLAANSAKPLPDQLNELNARFTDWKGELEQVDDVLVIGIKI